MSALRTLLHILLYTTLAIVSAQGHASLQDCQPPEAAQYVVFLSEPEFTPEAFESRAKMLFFYNRLQEYLDQHRDLEMAGISHVPFRVARCEGRIPAIDGKDFDRKMVRSLYSRGVVIEIWGMLDARRVNNQRTNLSAQMNYLLVPVKFRALEDSKDLPGIHRFNYPDTEIVATDFIDLISNSDLHAFVAAAIGVMAFEDEEYQTAHEMLCKANPQLGHIQERLSAEPTTQAQSEKIERLRGFLLNLAGEAIVKARNKPGTIPIFAKLQDEKNPCSSLEATQ